MKILGALLILGALIGGGIILSDTVPGYFRNKDGLVRARAEAAAAQTKLEAISASASSAAELDRGIKMAESAVRRIRFAEDSVARRRNETLLFGGGALAVLSLGTVLVLRGRRKRSGLGHPVTV